ncbi:MAG: ABC-three component system middle component 6 [Pleomorphochaeta sp.]
MLVNYESAPKNSILYSSSIVISYLKKNNNKSDYENLFSFCKSKKMEYSIFILTIDWLYLVNIIKQLNEFNEVILCD